MARLFSREYVFVDLKGTEPEPESSDTIQLCKCTLKNKLHANDLAETLQESERCARVHMNAGMQKQMHWTLFSGYTDTQNTHTPGMMSG